MSLALNCISTVAGKNIMSQLQGTIANFILLRFGRGCMVFLTPSEISPLIKKKSLMCMLQFFRISPESFPHRLLANELAIMMESASDLVKQILFADCRAWLLR